MLVEGRDPLDPSGNRRCKPLCSVNHVKTDSTDETPRGVFWVVYHLRIVYKTETHKDGSPSWLST